MSQIVLVTPPFVQMNTPYPATAYLKGFLNIKSIDSFQVDLGLEILLKIFTQNGLEKIFNDAERQSDIDDFNVLRILQLKPYYLRTIEPVIAFLQNKLPTLAHQICAGNYLPEAGRFDQLADLEWAFGNMGIQDKARHLATLYLEDLSDLIKYCADRHFGFSRYAERISRSAGRFDEIYDELNSELPYIMGLCHDILEKIIVNESPKMIAFTVPFPGNLMATLWMGKWIKIKYPQIKIVMGGGYPNTELRKISDKRVFEYVDFITLDDGELPIFCLYEHIMGRRDIELLKRTFVLEEDRVVYKNGALEFDFKQSEVGTPDYQDLKLDKYISVIELVNPMHRLWGDGRWNKMTLAHGCYWGKCTFCDISLSYIKDYEATTAEQLVDRIEEMILKTGEHGFHFVDEAAPPALLKALSLEILRRGLTVTWWTNIRFEKSFTADLCKLLVASGCIAVSGGLEVASDRLLKLIDKGITVEQVAKVTKHFTEAGIMVHAYLMYGFPTQTAQETIDSLEMVRQMIELGLIQSGFWHQFAMTAHSPIGLNPQKFKVNCVSPENEPFANNDLLHVDPTGANHEMFSDGLKKSLYNYMHGIGLEWPLNKWFDFKVPRTTISGKFIEDSINNEIPHGLLPKSSSKIVWLGLLPSDIDVVEDNGKYYLYVQNLNDSIELGPYNPNELNLVRYVLKESYFAVNHLPTYSFLEQKSLGIFNIDLSAIWDRKIWNKLSNLGLLVI